MKPKYRRFQSRATEQLRAMLAGPYKDLAGLPISCHIEKTSEGQFETALSWRSYRIGIDRNLHKAPIAAVRGGLAHELEHIAKHRRIGPVLGAIDIVLCSIFECYEIRDERQTDLAAIRRGFGNDLLALYKSSEYKYDSTDGLSPKEIMKEMQSEC